jgi:hypothetical protein
MPRFRLLSGACLLAGAIAASTGADAASASVFYVNGATGNDTHACTSAGEPCKTISAAVTKSEATPGSATIEVAAGVYQEELELTRPADNGIAINGAGSTTEIEAPASAKFSTVRFGPSSSTQSLSNIRVVNPSSDEKDAIEVGSNVMLDNVSIDMENTGEGAGIAASGLGGALSVNGGSITMESKTTGDALQDAGSPLSVNGTTITLVNGSTGTGIASAFASLSLSNVTADLGNTAKGSAIEETFGSLSLGNVVVNDGSTVPALTLVGLANAMANGVSITMEDAAGAGSGVFVEFGDGATFEHLHVAGAWKGPAFEDIGAPATLADSRLTSPAAPAAVLIGDGEGRGLLVQRSILQSPAAAEPGVVLALSANATLDSSEVLGGKSGIVLLHGEGKTRTVTIAESTIDAGELGVRDSGEVFAVRDEATGKASVADVNVEGSILFERQKAVVGAGGNAANVTCTYTDAPDQTQAATATEGAIACAKATNGNTNEPLTSLFSSPITDYSLLAGSSAVDSVPASAISLPFGITPSSTDLAGNPRVVDGNGDCIAVQDKGALELQGHSVPCPPIRGCPEAGASCGGPPPVPASITGLSISPESFFAAPSGATIAKAKKVKKYGATIGWRDSQAATTTFTVIRESKGRKQGKACKKPSKANKHGKPCTILTAIGSFTHKDATGANKAHFSGRLIGKKLAKGSYVLQAVPHNGNGTGRAVKHKFKIKG